MKFLLTLLLILVLSVLGYSGELTLAVSDIDLLIPALEDQDTNSSRIAIRFDLPDSLNNRAIVYSDISCNLDFTNFSFTGDATIEMKTFSITENWSSESANWGNLANDVNSDNFYQYTFMMSADSDIDMDVTHFVQSIVDGQDNFGLMFIPVKADADVIHFDQATS